MASTNLPTPHKRRCNIICTVVTLTFILLGLLIILAFTVFKPKSPITTINSMTLNRFNLSLDIPRFTNVHLNLTFLVNLSVQNPNKVGSFKYANGSAIVKYRGQVVGDALVPAGNISAKKTYPINLNMTVSADKILISNFNDVFNDVVVSGMLPLTTTTRIAGKAYIIKVLKIHVVSYTTCKISINVINMTISHWTCHSKF